MSFGKIAAAFGAAALLSACAAKQEATPPPEPAEPARPASIVGQPGATCGSASWYGDELRGDPTASGEPFNPDGLTAAHRELPLGSVILVEWEGEQVEVRVNDRGPYHGDRVLDLSRAAADVLGYTDLGAADVCFQVVAGA